MIFSTKSYPQEKKDVSKTSICLSSTPVTFHLLVLHFVSQPLSFSLFSLLRSAFASQSNLMPGVEAGKGEDRPDLAVSDGHVCNYSSLHLFQETPIEKIKPSKQDYTAEAWKWHLLICRLSSSTEGWIISIFVQLSHLIFDLLHHSCSKCTTGM